MASCRFGTTIIDELRLCFTAEPSFLQSMCLITIGERISFDKFSMVRIVGQHFRYLFKVFDDKNNQVGSLYFGQYGDTDTCYVWFKVQNSVLYSIEQLKAILTIPDILNLKFNNITALDLAKDFKKNIVNVIRRLYKDERITTIVNGRAIKDRKKIIPELHIDYAVSLDLLKNPTFYAKQKKALHDKTKGVCVSCYNKREEIETTSHKQYILDFYGNPKSLHRIEVHLNSDEIRTYCRMMRTVQSSDLIFDQAFITDMFFYHLASVVRFTQGRKKREWKDLLNNM